MSDHSRIEELRRRVQRDPSSIAFAQLAEEHRRAGQLQEAIDAARAGLVQHPAYLSARVTLGRALLELGQLDEAAAEFEYVVQAAPDNLTAVRQLAEIHQRRRLQVHETRSRMPEAGPPTTPSPSGDAHPPAASGAASTWSASTGSPAKREADTTKQEASPATQDLRVPTPETGPKPQIAAMPAASPAPQFIVELTSQTAHVAASVTSAPVPPPSPAPVTSASPAAVTQNAPQPAVPAPLDPVIAELEAWLAVLQDERTARAGHR